jgi:hypothetical protein
VVSIGIQAQNAEEQAQNAMEVGTPQDQRATLGALSVLMASLQEQAHATVEEFKDLVPDTIDRLIDAAQ